MNLAEDVRVLKLSQFVEDIVIHHIEQYIRWHVAPVFWEKFENTEDSKRGFELFKSAVDDLYINLTEFLPLLKKLEYLRQNQDVVMDPSSVENDIEARFKLIVRATLLSQLPLCNECIIEHFYKIAFNVFCNSDNLSQGKCCKVHFNLFMIVIFPKCMRYYKNIYIKSRCIN